MKKNIFITALSLAFFGATAIFVSSLSYPVGYYNGYTHPTNNSYTYTTGCNTYRYDGYSRTSTLVSSTCTSYNSGYGYNANYYQHYVQPVQQITYVAPTTQTIYVAPITTTYTVSPVYSYGYGSGYYDYGYNYGGSGYQNNPYYDGRRYHHTTDTWINNSYVDNYNSYTNIGSCYYSNGYQVCP